MLPEAQRQGVERPCIPSEVLQPREREDDSAMSSAEMSRAMSKRKLSRICFGVLGAVGDECTNGGTNNVPMRSSETFRVPQGKG